MSKRASGKRSVRIRRAGPARAVPDQGAGGPVLLDVPPDRIPVFNRRLGMKRVRAGGGHAEIAVALTENLTNRRGVAHGGLIAALLDSVLGSAVISDIRPEEWCGTMQIDIQFREPGLGARLTGRGRVVRRGRHVAFAVGEVVDTRGRVIATAQGTWYIWSSKPNNPPPPNAAG